MKVEIASSVARRMRGLLGRREFDGALLLSPCNDVHTFGMRRPIDIAFVSADGIVLESYRGVGACRRIRCRRAAATLERFASDAPWFSRGDRMEVQSREKEGPFPL